MYWIRLMRRIDERAVSSMLLKWKLQKRDETM